MCVCASKPNSTTKTRWCAYIGDPSANVPNTNSQYYRHFFEHALRELIDEVGSLEIKSVEGTGTFRQHEGTIELRGF